MSLHGPMPKCPSCQMSDTSKQDGQCAVCYPCSKMKQTQYRFCWACQREWPSTALSNSACTLPNCALRAALLSTKRISKPQSPVIGCPYFRACPSCKALVTHSGGCPSITCPGCNVTFCFRCLIQQYHGTGSSCKIVENSTILRKLGL